MHNHANVLLVEVRQWKFGLGDFGRGGQQQLAEVEHGMEQHAVHLGDRFARDCRCVLVLG